MAFVFESCNNQNNVREEMIRQRVRGFLSKTLQKGYRKNKEEI